MTKEEFQKSWILNFDATVPIPYFFKHDYSERWFRIHSLPESQRYADNEAKWEILLSRQNELITDLFGDDCPIIIVTGEYNRGDHKTIHITVEEEMFKPFAFTILHPIELFKIYPEQYVEADIYIPAFSTIVWKPNYYDHLLKEIATDKIRLFFVSFDKNIIVAPYDGGVDFVLKDSFTKEIYKNKYRNWLSKRGDEL